MSQPTAKCSSRSFLALIATQFLGAFNDNLFKTIVSLLVLNELLGKDGGGIIYLSLTAALFFLPYILFSALAGYLSDAYPKTTIVRATKGLEVFVMILGLIAFIYNSTWGLLIAIFLMGMQSALFSPSKYGLLPEMLHPKELSKANGYLEFTVFLAIIFGTAAAGLVSNEELGNPGYITLAIAIIGLICAYGVAPLPATGRDDKFPFDPFTPNIRNLIELKKIQALWLSVLGIAFFWSFGALFQLNILLYAKQILDLTDMQTSLMLACIGLGIGTGSVFAGSASEQKVELGLIPIGAAGLVTFNCLLGLVGVSLWAVYLTIIALGFSAGIFIVPVQTYLQEFSPPEKRGSYIAASNFFSFVSMLGVSFLFWFITDFLAIPSSTLFLLMGLVIIGIAYYLIRLMPETLTRCVNWLALHTFYRIQINGKENIPDSGGALIVCNHVTFVDAMLLLASFPRPIRFIMYRPIYESPFVYPMARLMQAIPISGKDGRESLVETLKSAAELIKEGELVGIFAEGGLTRDGEIQTFRTGLETIMEDINHPMIPIHLGGLWGSIFSHKGGKVFWKFPKKIPYPVTITIGESVGANTTAQEIEVLIRELSGEGDVNRDDYE